MFSTSATFNVEASFKNTAKSSVVFLPTLPYKLELKTLHDLLTILECQLHPRLVLWGISLFFYVL